MSYTIDQCYSKYNFQVLVYEVVRLNCKCQLNYVVSLVVGTDF